jgi:hypothetical protein
MAAGSNVVTNAQMVGSTNPLADLLRSTENRLNLLESAYRGEARVGPGVLAVQAAADLPAGVAVGTLVYVLDEAATYTMQAASTYGAPVPGYP